MFAKGDNANPANGEHILDYIFYNKVAVLRSGICLSTRLDLGITDVKRQITNTVESFNNQLQDDIQTDRKCSLFYIVQKII